jgi:hypothetical protein
MQHTVLGYVCDNSTLGKVHWIKLEKKTTKREELMCSNVS